MNHPLNPTINALHAAWCAAVGATIPLTATRERWWWEANKQGMTPDDVTLCIASRLRIKRAGGMAKGIELRHVCGDEVRIDELLCEAAVLRASQRVKAFTPGKASVLRATGRPDAPPQDEAKPVADSKLIQDLRKAAQ